MNLSRFVFMFVCFIATCYGDCSESLDPADDPKNIERPCLDFDMDCIRKYFADNSECKISNDKVPDPLIWNSTLYLPNTNMTVELLNANLGGINGKVVEFYFNKETENLVLAAEMHNLSFDSKETKFRYHRKQKEDIERTDHVRCNYGTVTLTVIFPCFCDLDLFGAEVYAYVEDSNPDYAIGPIMHSNLECDEEQHYNKLVASIPMDMQEALITHGKDFINNYIQYSICDFGI